MDPHTQARAASGAAPSHDPNTVQPITLPIHSAVAVTGLSRSAIYRAAAEGRIVLLKLGRSTLVDMASARAFVAALPRAAVGRGRGGATGRPARPIAPDLSTARTRRGAGGALGGTVPQRTTPQWPRHPLPSRSARPSASAAPVPSGREDGP
jgi:hypothetical protein